MKAASLLSCSIAALLSSISGSFGISDGILANTADFTPKITFSDTYTEEVDTEREDGEVYRSVVANPQKIAVAITADLTGLELFNPAEVAADTAVGVSVGNFDFFAELGEDEDYAPGKRSANFPYTAEVEMANGDYRTVRVGTVNVTWTNKVLNFKILCTDVEAAGISDIAAGDHVGEADAGTEVEILDDPVDVSVTFGEAEGTRTAFIRGVSKTVTKTFGRPEADDYEELDVVTVNLKGEADVDGPTIKATYPVRPRIGQTVSITGTAVDPAAITIDGAKLNGVAVAPETLTLGVPNENGLAIWSMNNFAFRKGSNVVEITFSDEFGNVTKLTKRISVTLK